MSNENLIKSLVEAIMKDERFVALMQNAQTQNLACNNKTLYLLEKTEDCSLVPGYPEQHVCCQENSEGKQGFISHQQAEKTGYEQLILINPSANLICKLALGIADEPIAKILQMRMANMDGQLSIDNLRQVEDIKNPAFSQYIHKQLGVLQSFGFQIGNMQKKLPATVPTVAAMAKPEFLNLPTANLAWSKRALTEKDLLGIEKNGAITVAEKCIVTSLATDMARRRGIKIYREGETQ